MTPIAELRTDHIDDDNLQHLDAYFTDDDNEEGKTIAVVDRDSGKVICFDHLYRTDKLVEEAIIEIRADIFEDHLMHKREMDKIFTLDICFYDVLHAGSDKLKEYYNGLSNVNKQKFIDQHAHSIASGCDHGLATGDVLSDIASNLECDTL